MTIGTFNAITIDANDAERIADFWSAVLGTTRGAAVDDGRFIFLEGREDLPVVCIQRVTEPKVGKTRIHLDLTVADLASATERIIALGGAWDGRDLVLESFRWRTMTDSGGDRVRHRGGVATGPARMVQAAARSRNARMKPARASACSGGTAL